VGYLLVFIFWRTLKTNIRRRVEILQDSASLACQCNRASTDQATTHTHTRTHSVALSSQASPPSAATAAAAARYPAAIPSTSARTGFIECRDPQQFRCSWTTKGVFVPRANN